MVFFDNLQPNSQQSPFFTSNLTFDTDPNELPFLSSNRHESGFFGRNKGDGFEEEAETRFLLTNSVSAESANFDSLTGAPQQTYLTEADKDTKARVAEAYGKIPLSFEQNQGQFAQNIDFISRGSGYSLFLTPTEAVLSLQETDPPNPPSQGGLENSETSLNQGGISTVIKMQIVGANPLAPAAGLAMQESKTNYFKGNNPENWHTDIANYGKVKYSGVYEGIDLVYYGTNQRQLQYDFLVAAGADPNLINLRFDGAEKLELDDAGDLILHVNGKQVEWKKSFVYQEIDGEKVEIPSWYILKQDNQVGFGLGEYDASKPLIIDPVLTYSTFLGGSGGDQGKGIAVDSSGNVYITGITSSTDFPTTAGAFDSSYNGGNYDIFVSKLNSTGTALVYSTYFGGNNYDSGEGIATDNLGNAYITGFTQSGDLPTTAGAYDTSLNGIRNAFVTKLNPNGTLSYSTFLGGNFSDYGSEIAVDSSGNAYVTGNTASSNFPTTAGAYDTSYNGGNADVFLTKINPTGTALVYSTLLGGSGADYASGIAVDSSGNAYLTGYTNSSNFATTAGAYDTSYNGGNDIFVTKINAAGSALSYSTFLGGSSDDSGYAIATDSNGNAYITGNTNSANFATTPGAYDTTHNGGNDIFVSKINAAGNALSYSTFLGGSSDDYGYSIVTDSNGNAYITGYTNSANFVTTPGAYDTTHNGGSDAFLSKLNATGMSLSYSTFIGSSNLDTAASIALDSSGNAYITGGTNSPGFPTTAGVLDTTHNGGNLDAFVAKFSFVNASPAINLAASAASYTENFLPIILDSTATVTDDSIDFGTLTVQFTANGSSSDRIAIRHQGTGTNQIGVSGNNISYEGTTIASFTGGNGTTPLVITFNSSDRAAAIQALLQNITFENISDNPSTSSRTVSFILTDIEGATSNTATKTINVTATNDAPILDISGNPTLTAIAQNISNLNNTGTLVSAIIANTISDADIGVAGIAVIAVDNSNGTWQFSTNNGSSWINFGIVSNSAATVLTATPNDKIRFVPNPNFNGNATITYRAWDTTNGVVSGTNNIDVSTNGGTSPFSSNSETATIAVLAVPTPEIQVLDGISDIADGTTTAINFGNTTVGTAVTKTFNIRNIGNAVLNLSGLSLPSGFSLVGSLPSSIAANGNVNLPIQLHANAVGNVGGSLQFTTNDSDEN
ncbi:MAG TPA: hypothetical protein DCY88_33905, partial [Cyanobacteria bacterium UBA11372]|nr:hypothetical protein [Cyanobacteria bacterium UBA11372]